MRKIVRRGKKWAGAYFRKNTDCSVEKLPQSKPYMEAWWEGGSEVVKGSNSFRAPWEVEFMAPGNGLDMGIEADCNPAYSQVSGLGSGGGGGVDLLWNQKAWGAVGVYGRLKSSTHGESEVSMTLPTRNVQEAGGYVARPKEKTRTFWVSNQMLTQRTQGKAGSHQSFEPLPLDFMWLFFWWGGFLAHLLFKMLKSHFCLSKLVCPNLGFFWFLFCILPASFYPQRFPFLSYGLAIFFATLCNELPDALNITDKGVLLESVCKSGCMSKVCHSLAL